ncbi:ABC transporter substrate-binding protein [Halosimplex salinum]|uniref:ABC transporter substrate-binding protein n=1 Tax=Halosimplex salinum TaxID=1710538 RepID=UPI000F4A5AAC|nr:ABC transporter substrate-binding protein [Halosimplex salinum]
MTGREAGSAGVSRRSVLATAAAAVGAVSGCAKRTRNVMARDPASQVSLRILTVPVDANPYPARIAQALAANLRACGVDAGVEPTGPEALYRRVLLDHDFDLYVGQFPRTDWRDPDHLYALAHSVYAGEPGWQNPFGYTNLQLDDALETQRTTSGAERKTAVAAVQERLAESQPFTTLAVPDALSAVRTDRFGNWRGSPMDPLTLLGLSPTGEATTLRLGTTDGRITGNRNPITAEFRTRGTFVDLLYDSLGRRVDGVLRPWLAADWRISERDGQLQALLSLREDLTWHDGEPLTADDVAFTYEFLADTSLGAAESPIPASRYRGRTSLVADVSVVDETTVRVAFADSSPVVAERAFTVPLLPEHVWAEQTETARVAGVETNRTMTEALAWNNPQPVGSGPLQFERAVPSESLRLSRFDDHFLRDDPEDLPERLTGAPAYEELRLSAVGSDDAAVELVAAGDADATVAPVGAAVVPRIGRESALDLVSRPSRAFYHLGFNTRTAPLSNTRFRRIVARLFARSRIVESVFDGYAQPAETPLVGTGWEVPERTLDDVGPGDTFVGEGGELDTEAARAAFVEAGYRYDDGDLLSE